MAKKIDNRSKTSAANGAKGGAPKIYDLEAAAKIGPNTRRCMEWLADATKTATGRSALARDPRDIARDLLADDEATRLAARTECIEGAKSILRRIGG